MTAGQKYDVLVIGGGINGLGIAADAAQRGLSVLIVEKTDWGSGTSSASSRLIHGGLRYLQYGEIDLVRESLRERGILTRQRPHLVHPIQLLIPTVAGMPTPKWMVGAGLIMYDILARDPMFPRPSMIVVLGGPAAVARRLQAELDELSVPVWAQVISWRPGESHLELQATIDAVLAQRAPDLNREHGR
ncbi:MAG: FAD-dependent oxidoreductase [Armatimonadota bacterium]